MKPEEGKQFVITGMVLSGNRDIGVNGSIVVIYGADAATATATSSKGKEMQFEVPKSTVVPLLPLNLLLTEGLFINGKCDDNSVDVTIFGYPVPAVPA